jgi:hypothetical protein
MILLPLLLSAPSPICAPVDAAVSSDAFALEASAQQPAHGSTPLPALAYSYIEADFLWTDFDDANENVTGFEFLGSVAFAKQAFAQISYSRQSNDADLDRFRIGAGYHMPLGPSFDAYGLLSIAHDELSDSGDDFSDTGLAAEVGLRTLVTSTFEVSGAVEWVDVHDSNFGLRFGARYFLTDSLSLGGRAEFIDNDVTFGAGLRLQF